MLESRQIKAFVTLAQDLHFAHAADRMGIAQSALSKHIMQLESDLGVRLFNRNKRSAISLTNAGEVFLVEALATLRQLERADQVGKAAARGEAGRVALGYVVSAVTVGLLPAALKQFRTTRPEVRMQVSAMATPRQLEGLKDGAIDVGLLRSRAHYPDGVVAQPVQRERLMIALSADHRLARARAIKPAQLRGQSFISAQFGEMGDFGEYLVNLGRVGGFDTTPSYQVADFISAVSMAAAGYGAVLVPESIKVFAPLGVTFKRIVDFDDEVQLVMAYRSRERSPCVKAFLATVLSMDGVPKTLSGAR
jgi:DNA-binding transcriptional LysR family regulator